MIDTANMGIMANFIQPTSSSISTQMISKKDSNDDSSLNIDEMGVSNDIFSSYDSDSNGLVSQSELTTAIDSAMSEFSGGMPSKEDFQSMLSSFGLEAPTQSENISNSQEETISSVLAEYDEHNLTQNDAKAIVAAFQDAGIEASEEFVAAMEVAGFDAKEVGTLANVGQGGTHPAGGGGGEQVQSSSSEEEEDDALDNLSMLMNMLKTGAANEESIVDTKSFDGILKAINNQNNNSNINLYLQNTNINSLSGYA